MYSKFYKNGDQRRAIFSDLYVPVVPFQIKLLNYTEHCSVWPFNDNRDGYRLQMGGVDLQQQDRTKKESIATARSYNFADVMFMKCLRVQTCM